MDSLHLFHYYREKQIKSMIHLDKLVFNSFGVNTYILFDKTGECIIIDPANYSEEEDSTLLSYIEQHNLTPVLHLNTHCHIDHVLGVHFVKNNYNIPFYTHIEEMSLLEKAPLMGEIFGFHVKPLPKPDKHLVHNDTISFGNSELRAIHVPGHSPGSLSYYSESDGFVITGDALFAGSIGRTDLPGGDYDILIGSITSNLLSLPRETTIWPGHGENSTIGNEKENNPFFNDYKT
jgi:hydroxyacylglutathione hydrolase